MLLIAVGNEIAQVLGAAEEVAVALPLGIVQDGIRVETIDNQTAVKVRAENFFGDLMATATADGIDGDVGIAEDPQPRVDGADPPAGFVGVDDVGPAEGV